MKKFAIIYGARENELQKRAIEELTAILLDYTLEYPVCLKYESGLDLSAYTCIHVGTRENHALIGQASEGVLQQSEAYQIRIKDGTAMIEGYDDAGVLYGVLDFYHKYIVKFEYPHNDNYWENFLEKGELPDFEYSSAPSIRERGLWTWGHVIYDYRGYLDHMMRLKMNRVIIWNDFLPVNAREIVEYAHARNIQVIWGFAWLWDTDCKRFDIAHLEGMSEEIFEKYEREYASCGGDGIYFQTFTELTSERIGDMLIAEAAAKFVNRTAGLFYEKYPELEIQFGLHATSVKERLAFIATVDPRVRIVWEDCGAFPFAYLPNAVSNFNETKQFVKTIGQLRGADDRFGVVTKGLVKLDWSKFEHLQGPQNIGVSSRYVKDNRVERKRRIWRYIQSQWMAYADKACEMVKAMADQKKGDLAVFALVEDGMFEENIMYPAALYAEFLWNAEEDARRVMSEVAMRSYVRFA